MEKIQNNLAEEILEHHGILGMHWGIRRYQPYPSDYSGDGKFMGKRHERKLAKIEKKKARHKAKVETIINNAIRDGDKKALNKIKSEIEESEYKDKYEQLVENGLANAVKDRSKENLKNFKEDLSPRDYKHQQDRIDFKKAIDDDDSKKAKKLLTKVDPEDVREATELIKSRVALQDQKLSKIRQDSELMAKLDKVNNSLTRVSNISKNIANISSNIQSMNDSISKFSKSASEAKEAREKKEIEKIVKSGNIAKIEEYKTRMDYNQLKDAYGKAYVMNQKNVDTAIAKGDVNEIYKLMPFMDSEQMTKAITKIKNIEQRGGAYHSDDSINEEVLAHHGILGMKWGIRRFQPYPKGYSGDGKYLGKELKKAAEKEGYRGIYKHPKVQEALKSDQYKKILDKKKEWRKYFNKIADAETEVDAAFDRVFEYEKTKYNDKTKEFLDAWDTTGEVIPEASKEFKDLVNDFNKKMAKADDIRNESDKIKNDIRSDIDKITESILGEYGNKTVSGYNLPSGEHELKSLLNDVLFYDTSLQDAGGNIILSGKEAKRMAKSDKLYEKKRKMAIDSSEIAKNMVEKRVQKKIDKAETLASKYADENGSFKIDNPRDADKHYRLQEQIRIEENYLSQINKTIKNLRSINFNNLSPEDKAKAKAAMDYFVSGSVDYFYLPQKYD